MGLDEFEYRSDARVLVLDIETRPILTYVWQLKTDYIPPSMVVDSGGVMCFAAKWFGERKITFVSDHHHGHDEVLEELWRLFDEADYVVGYNSRGFDVKHVMRELVVAGYGPPSPHTDIDLLVGVRRRFKFPSNKLDHISQELGIGKKVDHCGWGLWERCMAGDDKAWATMRRYNKHDVVLTEEVLCRVLPWLPNYPNMNMHSTARVSACDRCLSTDLDDAGFHYTKTRAYKRFRCNECGGYSWSTHHEPTMAQHRRGG